MMMVHVPKSKCIWWNVIWDLFYMLYAIVSSLFILTEVFDDLHDFDF